MPTPSHFADPPGEGGETPCGGGETPSAKADLARAANGDSPHHAPANGDSTPHHRLAKNVTAELRTPGGRQHVDSFIAGELSSLDDALANGQDMPGPGSGNTLHDA